MYTYKYPHPSVTADNVIFGFDGTDLFLLLVQRGQEPYKGCWALPGGFLEMDETIEECAKRELAEETHVQDIYLQQFHVFSEVERDPRERVLTVAFFALVRKSDYKVIAGDDASKASWFPLYQLPDLAFDHQKIIALAQTKLQEEIRLRPIAFKLLDKKFTLDELQHLYELINNTRYDQRDFQRQMLTSDFLLDMGVREDDATDSHQHLYSFDEESYELSNDNHKANVVGWECAVPFVKESGSRKVSLTKPMQSECVERIAPDDIHQLNPGEIFVFGSNLAGQHLGGAARAAHRYYGAIMGQGVGLQGQSYAIPTMQGGVETIRPYVDEFICFAEAHPELKFLVTRIGCGIAGFREEEIAPLFKNTKDVKNIYLPKSFWEILK